MRNIYSIVAFALFIFLVGCNSSPRNPYNLDSDGNITLYKAKVIWTGIETTMFPYYGGDTWHYMPISHKYAIVQFEDMTISKILVNEPVNAGEDWNIAIYNGQYKLYGKITDNR